MTVTLDDVINGLSRRPPIPFYKASMTTKGAAYFQSLWTDSGNPSSGVAAGSVNGAICTKDTAGALKFNNAATGYDTFLAKVGISGAVTQTMHIYDRLWHNSGLSGIVTTAQAISQPALTRYTNGVGVEAWLEIYTATGSTGVTATLSYTNSDGVSGRTATANLIATPVVGQMMAFTLQTGDQGVLSVQSVTLSATTGTAGNFGVTLKKSIAEVPLAIIGVGQTLDFANLGLPKIEDDACISFMDHCTGTTSAGVFGTISIIELPEAA